MSSPLAPFRFGGARVSAVAPRQPRETRAGPSKANQRPRIRPGLTALQALCTENSDEGEGCGNTSNHDETSGDNAATEGGDANGSTIANAWTGPDGKRPEDADAFSGRRRKIKRARSRIARPKDSMAGFKQRRGGGRGSFRSGVGGGGGGGGKHAKSGTATVSRNYLNRRISAEQYYGKDVLGGGTKDDGAEEDAGQEVQRMERELMRNGPAVEIGVPKCTEHGLFCAKLQVKKRGENKGRWFYKCSHPQRYQQCPFFLWEDEATAGDCEGEGDFDESESESSAEENGDADLDKKRGLRKRKRHRVGSAIPVAPATFPVCDGTPCEELRRALRKVFRHQDFKPGQVAVLKRLMRGFSTLAVLPTGGGKSLCYQLFAAVQPGVVVVITPLISLMADQLAALPASVPGACLRAGQAPSAALAVERKLLAGELKVLFVAPERLFVKRFRRLMQKLPDTHISLVVVDEAHCISQMGHNFRTSYLRLQGAFYGNQVDGTDPELSHLPLHGGLFAHVPILAMTATATSAVVRDVSVSFRVRPENIVQEELSRRNLRLAVSQVNGSFDAKARELVRILRDEPFTSFITRSTAAKNTNQSEGSLKTSCAPVMREPPGHVPSVGGIRAGYDSESETDVLVDQGREANIAQGGTILVYVSKQRDCETLCNYLRSSRLSIRGSIDMYHAGMSLPARANVQKAFDKGDLSVLVATVAFGMGLDSMNVRGVIHFDIPFSIEAYAQEIGRAGRDGQPAACHVFSNSADECRLRSRAHSDGVDLNTVRQFLKKLFHCNQIPRRKPSATSAAHGADQPSSHTAGARIGSDHSDDSCDGTFAEAKLRRTRGSPRNTTRPLMSQDLPAGRQQIADSVHGPRLTTVSIFHRFVERELDVRPETCETICAYLERLVPGFQLLPSCPGTLRIRFFSKTPAQLVQESKGLTKDSREILQAMMKCAKNRNGVYELPLHEQDQRFFSQGHQRLSAECMLQVVRTLKAGRHIDFELADESLSAIVPTSMLGNEERVNRFVPLVHGHLVEIESVRRRKADSMIDMLQHADTLLSDEEQSQFLQEALTSYFAADPPHGEKQPGGGADVGKQTNALVSAVRSVLAAQGYGATTPRTPRQVARILHGIQSPAFPAKDWCRCPEWGSFVHIDFRVAKAMAAQVLCSRSLARPTTCNGL